jgi:hypothetical protein
MNEKTESDRVRAPLSDADRYTISLAMKHSVRDEVLDVVVERLARDLRLSDGPPVLRLRRDDDEPPPPSPPPLPDPSMIEPRVNAWSGLARSPVVTVLPREGPVLAKIG